MNQLHEKIASEVVNTLARISIPPRCASEIMPSSFLVRDLCVDSLSFLELLIQIENAFEIRFADDMVSVDAFSTVKSLIDYVEARHQDAPNIANYFGEACKL